jgi:hypothetical protein
VRKKEIKREKERFGFQEAMADDGHVCCQPHRATPNFGGATVCGVKSCRDTLGIEWPVKLVTAAGPYKTYSLTFSLTPPQAVT